MGSVAGMERVREALHDVDSALDAALVALAGVDDLDAGEPELDQTATKSPNAVRPHKPSFA